MDNIHHPILDAIDLEILMHRNAHFSGDFSSMLEYYQAEGVGCLDEFSVDRIAALKAYEDSIEQDLGEMLLPDLAKQQVEESKKLYLSLRQVYETEVQTPLAKAISDLILSEEEIPTEEMKALISIGSSAVDPLLEIIRSDAFYDPLFPGYGRSPIFASKVLSQLRDPRAIAVLFDALSKDNFFVDDALLESLAAFGEEAIAFLSPKLLSKPYGKDTERAALALSSFPPSEQISLLSISLLEDPEISLKPHIAPYAIFACAETTSPEIRDRFIRLFESGNYKNDLAEEMKLIIKKWNKN